MFQRKQHCCHECRHDVTFPHQSVNTRVAITLFMTKITATSYDNCDYIILVIIYHIESQGYLQDFQLGGGGGGLYGISVWEKDTIMP